MVIYPCTLKLVDKVNLLSLFSELILVPSKFSIAS
nr:MAG TPA: hypothetical protein [Caudoviricetes sp.]